MSTDSSLETKLDKSSFGLGLLLGIVIGGVGGYYLTTPKGRVLLKTLTQELGDQLETLKDHEIVKKYLLPQETPVDKPSRSSPKKRFFRGISLSQK